MFKLINVNLEKEMDEALHYVAKNLSKSGYNSKPVLFHSFKLGLILYSYNYSREIVLSGILHDLLEDTLISVNEIENKFGVKIREIVEIVSFDPSISDEIIQARKMYKNCSLYGFDALIVKCADLLDNIKYIKLVNIEKRKILLKKYEMFLKIAKKDIENEAIYKELEKEYMSINFDKENK